jgi:hypothetical protein
MKLNLDEKIIAATVLLSNKYEDKKEILETVDEILHCTDGWEKAMYFSTFIVSLAFKKVKDDAEVSAKEAVLSYYADVECIDKTLLKELRKEYVDIFGKNEENDKLIREVDIRSDWKKALLSNLDNPKGFGVLGLAYGVGCSFTKEDLMELAKIYQENKDLREMIEIILEAANYHKEASDFAESNLEKYLNGDKIKTVIATTTEKFYLKLDSSEYENEDELLEEAENRWDFGEFCEFGDRVVEFSIE